MYEHAHSVCNKMRIKMSHACGEIEEDVCFVQSKLHPLIFFLSQTVCNAVTLPRKDCNSAVCRQRLFENCNLNL